MENGRIVVDEPTDLPAGTVLEVGSLQIVDDDDDLDDEEREQLHESLDEALEDLAAGRGVDGNEVIRRLLQRT